MISTIPCFIIFNQNNLINFVFKTKREAKEFAYEQFGSEISWALVDRDDLVNFVKREKIKLNLVEKNTLKTITLDEIHRKKMQSFTTDFKLLNINKYYEENKPFLITYKLNEWQKINI
jgi:hypothetical protein